MNKFFICLAVLATSGLMAQNQEVLEVKPLYQVVPKQSKKVSDSGQILVPIITWGGDVATIYTEKQGFFKSNGLDVKLYAENNFPKQVEACLTGKTPYLRGTMGMINAAAETFKKQGIDLVVVYQLTWSVGGDALVARPGVKRPKKLRDKTVALQLYGPHMDYLGNVLGAAGVPLNKVNLKWFRELTLPTYDTNGKTLDPVNAFLEDDSIDAVMCIIPDAQALTSGGGGGTGAAGSVKGAQILLSTKTASRIIADVYAVRSDYLSAHRGKVESFVKSLMQGEEGLRDLRKNKSADYQQLMSRSADLLLGAPQAVPDVEALLGDCEFVGFNGNTTFFSGKGTTRSMKQLTKEIQGVFTQIGLMDNPVALKSAEWDYGRLAGGLKYAKVPSKPKKPKFDASKVAKKIEAQISVESTSWADEGTLFQVEINFEPNQSEFTTARYAGDFKKALEISETYGGSLIVIEGHSDPLGVARARKNGKPAVEVRQMEQQAKNLSLARSRSVRSSFLDYCKQQSITVDESQFVSVGLGTATPKFNPPRTKEEWAANRRVVFRIKQVEAELTEFTPLD